MAAAEAEGVPFYARSGLNWFPIAFSEVLDKALSEGAEQGGAVIFGHHFGDQPMETAAAIAYFKANK